MRTFFLVLLLCACDAPGRGHHVYMDADTVSTYNKDDGGYGCDVDDPTCLSHGIVSPDMSARDHGHLYTIERDMSSGYSTCSHPISGPMFSCLTDGGKQHYERHGLACIVCQNNEMCVSTFLGNDILCLASCGECF